MTPKTDRHSDQEHTLSSHNWNLKLEMGVQTIQFGCSAVGGKGVLAAVGLTCDLKPHILQSWSLPR